jgi:hypothetical protein
LDQLLAEERHGLLTYRQYRQPSTAPELIKPLEILLLDTSLPGDLLCLYLSFSYLTFNILDQEGRLDVEILPRKKPRSLRRTGPFSISSAGILAK